MIFTSKYMQYYYIYILLYIYTHLYTLYFLHLTAMLGKYGHQVWGVLPAPSPPVRKSISLRFQQRQKARCTSSSKRSALELNFSPSGCVSKVHQKEREVGKKQDIISQLYILYVYIYYTILYIIIWDILSDIWLYIYIYICRCAWWVVVYGM